MQDKFQASESSAADPWVCLGTSTLPDPGHPEQFPLLQPAALLLFLCFSCPCCHLHILFVTSRLGLGCALRWVVHLKESRHQAVGLTEAGCLQHIPNRLQEQEQDGYILFRVLSGGTSFPRGS